MRTVPFQRVLWGVARKLGLDPARDLSASRAATLTEYINNRVEEGWCWTFWQEWTVAEERWYRAPWDAGTAYAVGDVVWYGPASHYYEATAAGLGQAPATQTGGTWEPAAGWANVTRFDRYVAWEQEGQTAIGEVKRVTRRDPRVYPDKAFPVGFRTSQHGVQVEAAAPNSVWVEFRKRPPVFGSDVWLAVATYAAGAVVYLPASGECYRSLHNNNSGQNPASSAADWERVEFPAALQNWVKQAAFADGLRDLKQTDRAKLESVVAYGWLNDAADRESGQQAEFAMAGMEGYGR